MKKLSFIFTFFLIGILPNIVLGDVFICEVKEDRKSGYEKKIVIQYSEKKYSGGSLIPFELEKEKYLKTDDIYFTGIGTVKFNKKENDLYILQYWSKDMYFKGFFYNYLYELVSLRIGWANENNEMPIRMFAMGSLLQPFWSGLCKRF